MSRLAHQSAGAASPGNADRFRPEPVLLTAALAWAAAVIHAVAAPEHLAESALVGGFFLVVAPLQVLWGAWTYRRPERRLLLGGASGSLAIVALWAFTRTVGIPAGPDAWQPEPVGVLDVVATADELLTAGVAVALARGVCLPASAAWRLGRPLAYALLVASLLAPTLGVHGH
jgi:hypothetical protein